MKNDDAFPLLFSVDTPADLRQIDESDLPQFCDELRQFLIESVAVTGGHLGASLGTVELTVALHYVFNTPADQLVWDVGHQTYGHKILTGRRDQHGDHAQAWRPCRVPQPRRIRIRHLRCRALQHIS